MTRRGLALFLLLVASLPLAAQRRRSVVPGDPGRCSYGTLAELSDPPFVALDETYVYFANDFIGRIERVPKRGGDVEGLYEVPLGEFVLALHVDEVNVYLAAVPLSDDLNPASGNIIAVPKSGGLPHNVATGVLFPNEIASDATHVYWVSVGTIDFIRGTAQSDGKIERARKDGSGRETLAGGLSTPFSLVLSGGDVFFSELGQATGNPSAGVRRVAKSGGQVTPMTEGWIVADLQQTAGEIVFYGARSDDSELGIHAVAKSGGAVRSIVVDEDIVAGPRVFDGFVYYTTLGDDEEDHLMRVPVAGGAPQFLRIAYMGYPDFEVDSCAIYYGLYYGLSIVSVPR